MAVPFLHSPILFLWENMTAIYQINGIIKGTYVFPEKICFRRILRADDLWYIRCRNNGMES